MIDSLSQPRTIDPTSVPAFHWGVVGTGWIAGRFITTATRNTSQRVVVVGFRFPERAHEFAEGHGIEMACSSYGELMAQDVNVVYVATGHLDHASHARFALEAGRNVLVEKPMTPAVEATRELIELARNKDLFCVEAVWSLALPRFDVVRQVLAANLLSKIEAIAMDTGEYLVDHRRAMDPARGGGTANGLGIYPLMFANWVLPGVEVVVAAGPRHVTGTVEQFMALLGDDKGHQASMFASMLTDTPSVAVIRGGETTLVLDGPLYRPGPVKVRSRDGRVLSWGEPHIHHEGLLHETVEVARCITVGHTESPLRPLEATIVVVELMEQARALTSNPT